MKSLQTSFWLMVALQTVGSVDMPGKGPRKMPSPRSYVALAVVWSVLSIIADMGAERAAAAAAWVITLTGMVVGPFGQTLVNLFNSVATGFSVSPSGASDTSATPSTNDMVQA